MQIISADKLFFGKITWTTWDKNAEQKHSRTTTPSINMIIFRILFQDTIICSLCLCNFSLEPDDK